MNKLIKYMAVVLFVNLFFINIAAANQDSAILAQTLNNIHSLRSNFAQVVYDTKGKVLQQTAGEMFLLRPGKFRWEVTSPSHQILIADGKKIWFYDVDLSQVTVQRQESSNSNSPAMLLSGSAEQLTKNFLVNIENKNGQQIFELKPYRNSGLFQKVDLTFANNQLTSMLLVDNLGQITKVAFSAVKNNPVFPAGLFNFKVPKGVDVVSQ